MMNEGLSAADIAAVTGGNNGGWGGFGDNGWWVILLFLVLGGRGFGSFGGNGCGCTEAINLQTITSKLDQQTYGMADSTYALNNTIVNGFNGVERGLCDVRAQMSDCCCQTQRQIERGFCDLTNTVNMNTRSILDYLTNDKIECLRNENQALKFNASQLAQNNYLISQLRPLPVPAYVVDNPYTTTPA